MLRNKHEEIQARAKKQACVLRNTSTCSKKQACVLSNKYVC